VHNTALTQNTVLLFYSQVFCLGVLYHTPDPMGMLRKIHLSMKPGGQLIVDCMGIPDADFGHLGGDGTGKGAGNAPLCLMPRSRYTNMKGVWFLPTLQALLHWIARANFRDAKCFFAEPLSVEEQVVRAAIGM
jgi:tRNA (mo5U34)-methyltransferase